MNKWNILSDFEKGEMTTLKRVGKSQRGISKASERSKTVICNFLKIQITMVQENRMAGQKSYHHNSKEEFFAK